MTSYLLATWSGGGNVPPTLAIAAECDPLADDAAAYAARLTAAGTDRDWVGKSALLEAVSFVRSA